MKCLNIYFSNFLSKWGVFTPLKQIAHMKRISLLIWRVKAPLLLNFIKINILPENYQVIRWSLGD